MWLTLFFHIIYIPHTYENKWKNKVTHTILVLELLLENYILHIFKLHCTIFKSIISRYFKFFIIKILTTTRFTHFLNLASMWLTVFFHIRVEFTQILPNFSQMISIELQNGHTSGRWFSTLISPNKPSKLFFLASILNRTLLCSRLIISQSNET